MDAANEQPASREVCGKGPLMLHHVAVLGNSTLFLELRPPKGGLLGSTGGPVGIHIVLCKHHKYQTNSATITNSSKQDP